MPFNILFLSTSVGALGTGLGGGVELTLYNMAQILLERGHRVRVVAPEGSVLAGISIEQIAGNLQVPAQTQDRSTPICIADNSVLANMWDCARKMSKDCDILVNFAYDWLPFYLTPFFDRPIAHFVSMGSLNAAMDRAIEQTMQQFPGTVGFYTKTQAATFEFARNYAYPCLGKGLDLSLYEFCSKPGTHLAWLGRISPEKALEDAVAAAKITKIPLKIWGKMQDESYWQQIGRDYPDAPIEYCGFLSTEALQKELRQCRGLLMTPRWIEAFGNVAIEALACGVPVIAYRRGGPAEIVRDGKTGWLVEPDSVAGLVTAIERIDEIDRRACRQQAEEEYSLETMGKELEDWFDRLKIENA
jgi:UDP-glucose:tetrahydrobiopterin glucosyltransferase